MDLIVVAVLRYVFAAAAAAVQEHVDEIVGMTYQYLNMIREEGIQVRTTKIPIQ